MNNYQSITASPEALAAFLGSIPAWCPKIGGGLRSPEEITRRHSNG